MQLSILGSGTGVPVPGRAPSGYLVSEGDDGFLLELGAGTIMRAVNRGMAFKSFKAILLSHFHLDHSGDLPSLLFALNNPANPRHEPLFLAGPVGLCDLLDDLVATYGSWVDVSVEKLRVMELEPLQSVPMPGMPTWSLDVYPVEHGAGGLGFRISSPTGRILAYTGDTALCDSLFPLAQSSHLLLAECSAPNHHRIPGHMTPSDVGYLAKKAKPNKVVLTHFYPHVDVRQAAKEVYDLAGVASFHGEDGQLLQV